MVPKNNIKKIFTTVASRLGNIDNYKQQKLPAWQPFLTATSVLPTFVLVSVALIITGAGFLYLSNFVQVFELDYTYCMPMYGTQNCAQILHDWREQYNSSWPPPECVCWYKFNLEDNFTRNVYVYYGMYNYYQNHLHYIRSKDMSQFEGEASANADCQPFRTRNVWINGKRKKKSIVPCGTIANSLFNDTFVFWFQNKSAQISIAEVPLDKRGIAWSVDSLRFKNPKNIKIFANFTNPPYWGNRTIWNLDTDNPNNNGLQNEALIVWMRTAAFPAFWKLYARVAHRKNGPFDQLLPSGQYYLKILYNYPVSNFEGRKSFIIANTNEFLGGSYFFLAILYLVVGGLCAIAAIVLLILYLRFGISKEEYVDIDEKTLYFFDRLNRNK